MKRTELYQTVTNRIIELLETQLLSWDKPWVSLGQDGKPAHNAQSLYVYQGVNQLLLSSTLNRRDYPKNSWLTFLQIKTLGGHVKKKEKASQVYFQKVLFRDKDGKKYEVNEIKVMSKERKKALSIKMIPYLKRYNVFNIAQTEGLPEEFYYVEPRPEVTAFEKDERAESLLFSTGANIVIRGTSMACYHPKEDKIYLPLREQFTGTEEFYETALHECAHWSGHESRLGRDLTGRFGSEVYAKEELIAELTAAFLCAYLGFEKVITNNAAYIQSWLSKLQNDHHFIFKASRDAEKASEFILEKSKSNVTVSTG